MEDDELRTESTLPTSDGGYAEEPSETSGAPVAPDELVGVLRPDSQVDYEPLGNIPLEIEVAAGSGGFVVLEPIAVDDGGHQILRVAAIVLRGGKYSVTPQGDGWLVIDLKEDRIPSLKELNEVIAYYDKLAPPIYAPTTRPPIIYP